MTAVSTNDRLSFTFFLAAALHGLIIFGVAFDLVELGDTTPSVTVTLATHQSREEPDEADFIAESNQIGSGTLDEAKQITTDQLSPFNSETIAPTELPRKPQSASDKPQLTNTIATTANTDREVKQSTSSNEQQQNTGEKAEELQLLTEEIASLAAKLDRQRQEYAKRPRERILTSVSTKSSNDAAYLNDWTRKVESVGNTNFPREALQQKITGSLRLQTIVKWDGTLVSANILESSGHKLLDNAALQIIHQAAPFKPFPQEIRKDTDQLAIIRTWNFAIDGLSTTQ